jgi:hypothetical protein
MGLRQREVVRPDEEIPILGLFEDQRQRAFDRGLERGIAWAGRRRRVALLFMRRPPLAYSS